VSRGTEPRRHGGRLRGWGGGWGRARVIARGCARGAWLGQLGLGDGSLVHHPR
jgi:hypothetical protein